MDSNRHNQPGHTITLLARQLQDEWVERVIDDVSRRGLVVESQVWLSEPDNSERACIELALSGAVENEKELRSALMALSDELGIDIAFQLDSIYRCNRRLAVFDMDSTLIQAEVIDELAKAAGVGNEVVQITEAAMRGELDFKQSFARRLGLLKGLDASVVEEIAESLQLTDGCERLINTLHKLGYKTAIVSGGFNYFGRYLQRKLGFTYVYANELDVVDGAVTGQVKGTVVDGSRKAELLRELAEREGLSLDQVIAVGDGANDLPMLSIAGLGVAFHAKPLVKATADHSISVVGLDGVLYMLGLRDRDIDSLA